jgi:putative ABC transport system substrate-binding protein
LPNNGSQQLQARGRGALLVFPDSLMISNRDALIAVAALRKIPTVHPIREFAARGGLVSYGTNYPEAHAQVGELYWASGEWREAENLPVRQVTTLQLVINLKAAKALGITSRPLSSPESELIE